MKKDKLKEYCQCASCKKIAIQARKDTLEEVKEELLSQDFMEYLGDVPTQYLSAESNAHIESHDTLVDEITLFLDQLSQDKDE